MRRKLWRGLFLTLLFFGSMIFSPVIAQARFPAVQVQSQVTTSNLLLQAQTQYQQGKFEQAVILWQQLADQYSRQADSLNAAMALSNLSLTYQQLGNWGKAKEVVNDSVELLQDQQNLADAQRIFAQTLDVQGRLEWQIGQSEKSLTTWKVAANLYKSLGDEDGLQKNLLNQSKALQNLGFYPKTCRTVLEAFNIEVKTDQTCDLSENENEILNEFLDKPDSARKFEAMQRLGSVQQIVGLLEQSKQILEAGLQWSEAQGSNEEIATSYLNLGNTEWAIVDQAYRREYTEEEFNFDCSVLQTNYEINTPKVTECQNYIEDLGIEDSSYDDNSTVELPSSNPNIEKITLDRSPGESYFTASQIETSPLTKLQAKLNLFTLLVSSEQWDKALEFFENSIQPPLKYLPSSRASIYAQIQYSKNALLLKKALEDRSTVNEIEKILNVAFEQAKNLGDRKAESHTLGVLGELYEDNQQWSKAQYFTEQALKIAPTYNNPELAYQLSWQLGRIYKEQEGKLDAAIASYTNAFTTLESLQGDLVSVSPELQFSFRERVEPVYRELVDLRLQKAEQLQKSANQQQNFQDEMVKVREVIEALQLAELNNFFREACVEANPQIIDQVSPTAAVIYPIILEDRLEIILSLPESDDSQFKLYRVGKDKIEGSNDNLTFKEQFNLKLEEFRRSLKTESEILTDSQQLYNLIIRPIEPDLEANEKIDTLVFVLDGLLRNVPMSALHDGNEYLVEKKYSIALTPGLQLLNPEPITEEDLIGLLAGAENFDLDDYRNRPLPDVPRELEEVEKTLLNSEKLFQDDFTSGKLRDLIEQVPFPVIHLATHGNFGSTAEETYIVTSQERVDVNALEQLLRKPDEKNPIELLVLSACETADGDDRAALGLAGIAVRAGARSTLATLWKVADNSTASLMIRFYEELTAREENLNKAEALKAAQLALLKNEISLNNNDVADSETLDTSHPYYWAPFVLVGNWQ